MAVYESEVGTRRRAAVRVATILALVAGCMALAPVSVQGQEIRWQPVASDGDVVCMPGSGDCKDTQIILERGDATVTLFLQVSGWDPGGHVGDEDYFLGAFQGTVQSTGYAGGGGCDLVPIGQPNMGMEGAFQALKVCANAPYNCDPGVQQLLTNCSSAADCAVGQLCMDRCDFVYYQLDSTCTVSTATIDYSWSCGSVDCREDPRDGTRFYGGTLLLYVPVCAAGTYIVNFYDDVNFTLMNSCPGPLIPGLQLKAAQITVETGQCCYGIGTVDEDCADGLTADECAVRPGPRLPIDPNGTCATDACCQCLSDNDCDDGDVCTVDTCANCTCTHVPYGDIPSGVDSFTTKCDGDTFVHFGVGAIAAIPADYFYEGSPEFSGRVWLGGREAFQADTWIRRLAFMCFSDALPETVLIPTEISQLELVSCTPLDVGGVLYDVIVRLDPGPQPASDLTVTKDDRGGGTFTANLNVDAEAVFQPAGGGEDVGPPIPLPVNLTTDDPAPWLQDDTGALCAGSSFCPGWELNVGMNAPCCVPVCHAGPSPDHPHCVQPTKCDKCSNIPNDTPPKCEACDDCTNPAGDTSVSHPVYLFSGEFSEEVTDLRIPGRGVDFVWSRKYRSKIGRSTAQGINWDAPYNLYLEESGPDLTFFDGTGRKDRFAGQGDGTWTRREYFRVIGQEPDGTYTMTHADKTVWTFAPFDGSPAQGKIIEMTDRNGNTMAFDYDGAGRLVTIHDTLDTPTHTRDITIAYNSDGFVESVADWAGRRVRYAYYQDGDAGGSSGDLKSVTYPAVINTPEFPIPPGHEYRKGKTWTYTYTKGFADDRLNHNLLTITDGRRNHPTDPTYGDGAYLTNVYSDTINPGDLTFDRVVAQVYGGGRYDYTYVVGLDPGAPENNGAVVKAISNNRAGDVKELLFDAGNRLVVRRDYTGRWDPGLPTTDADLLNPPPIPRLRPPDPAYFETRWIYNNDSRLTRIIHPNGNEEVFTYDTLNPDRRSRGNLLEHCWQPGTHEPAGDQAEICESFEYDDGFGACCGANFVTNHVDGRGNEILHDYDDDGNRIHTTHRIPSIVEDWEYNSFGQMTAHILPDNGSGHRRRDQYTYYQSGPQRGYQHRSIIDAPNFALTTTYEYDAVGNVTRAIDPRGHGTQYVYNQLNQVVREISREVELPTTARVLVGYERDTFYDANDNVARVDIQNVDEGGTVVPGNPYFSTIYEYDILNFRTRTCAESGSADVPRNPLTGVKLDCAGLPESEFITTEHEYDANRNRTLVRYGEAAEGRQPANTVRTLYDERDLVFRVIRAEGDPDQSTSRYDYDQNSNVTRIHEGLEDVAHVTVSTFDGYDRVVSTEDPMGNVATYHYDANHNRVSARVDGERVDLPGGVGNVRLSETAHVYDPMDRLTRAEAEFFDTETQTPLQGGQQLGKSISTTEWSDNSQVLRVVNDNLHQTLSTYDTANRRSVGTDHKGNTVSYTYDENSNVTSTTETEKSDLANPDETFTTTYAYDNLDRLTQTTDNVGNTHTYGYDSRDNRTVTVDALNHETRYEYDGINRLAQTIRDLDGDGADGDGDDITTTQAWDDTSRLTAQADDKGNTTRYAYDALSRLVVTQMADGTIHQTGSGAVWVKGQPQPDLAGFTSGYDVHDNRITNTDANGSVSTSAYDLLDRLISKAIAPGADVSSDTTFEIYEYDGLSRLVHAEDNDSVVTRSYDSLSRVTRETLNDETTTDVYDGVGNQLTCTYPGGRIITTEYDELERKKTISDGGGTIATYAYVGPGRVERREYGNGTRTDYTYDGITGTPNPANDFGVKRIIGTTHSVIAGGAIVDDRTFTWDKMYNKTQRKDIRGGPRLTHDYTYDDIYRLVHTRVTDGSPPLTVRDTDYDLDGVGNRSTVAGAPDPGAYTMDPTQPEPADEQMNQYTTTPTECRVYDDNGNLVRKNDSGPCEISVAPPGLPPDPTHQVAKHRYLSIDVATNGAQPVALRVELVSLRRCSGDRERACTEDNDCDSGASGPCNEHPDVGSFWWVQMPQEEPLGCLPGPCGPTDQFARVDTTPVFNVWTLDTLHVGDCEIIPVATYEIRACLPPGGTICSDPLTIGTITQPFLSPGFRGDYGDVAGPVDAIGDFTPPDGNTNVVDVSAYILTNQNYGTVNKPQTHPTWVDLHGPGAGNPPQYILNVSDLGQILKGFGGDAWTDDPGNMNPSECNSRRSGGKSGPPRAGVTAPDSVAYDYRNQMVKYTVIATGERHTYAYDALGRRIAKTVGPPPEFGSRYRRSRRAGIRHSPFAGPPAVETRYFYDGWQVVEEQDAVYATRSYVYGLYIDEVLNVQRSGVNYYYHTDDLYNVMAITNGTATVVERYEYADYGQPIDPTTLAPIPGDPSAVGNPYLFTGRRYDPETAWYHYRTRYLDPTAGRFTTRDTIGIWGDSTNLGNGYAYVANNPLSLLDPMGDEETTIKEDKDKIGGFIYEQNIGNYTAIDGFGVTTYQVLRSCKCVCDDTKKPKVYNWKCSKFRLSLQVFAREKTWKGYATDYKKWKREWTWKQLDKADWGTYEGTVLHERVHGDAKLKVWKGWDKAKMKKTLDDIAKIDHETNQCTKGYNQYVDFLNGVIKKLNNAPGGSEKDAYTAEQEYYKKQNPEKDEEDGE